MDMFATLAIAQNLITTDYSLVVGLTAVSPFPAGALKGRRLTYMRLWNVAAVGGGTLWLCRNGGIAVINGAGSFPLSPGQFELFVAPQSIPVNNLSVISTLINTPLTIEVG